MKPVTGRPKNVDTAVVTTAAGARPLWFNDTRCEPAALPRPTDVALTPTKSRAAQPFGNSAFVPSATAVVLTEPSRPDVVPVGCPVAAGLLRIDRTFTSQHSDDGVAPGIGG